MSVQTQLKTDIHTRLTAMHAARAQWVFVSPFIVGYSPTLISCLLAKATKEL